MASDNAPHLRATPAYVTPDQFRQRHFPSMEKGSYLAACSLAPLSTALDTQMASMLSAMGGNGLAWPHFEEEVSRVRTSLARLIGARTDQIALLPNATVGAYQVASTLQWNSRPGMVYSSEEFPSLAHVWLAQRARGARPASVRNTGGHADLAEQYARHIGPETRLVSIPHTCYRHGQTFPVKIVAAYAHAAGAKVFVDAYQSVGVQRIDVNELDCDFLVGGTMKYLLGLPGLAFLYVRDPLGNDVDPTLTGWFGRKRPFDFDSETLDFPDGAARFETGTPAIPSIYAANAGMALIEELNLDTVQAHVASLIAYMASRAREQGETLVRIPQGGEHGAHLALRDHSAGKLAASLQSSGITASARGDSLRLALHYYSSAADIDACCDAVVRYRRTCSSF